MAECPEDLDNDGLVNVNDILLLLGEFGCAVNCTFDLNGINGVDVAGLFAPARSLRLALFEWTPQRGKTWIETCTARPTTASCFPLIRRSR